MRALKLTGPGTLELVETPVPDISSSEVLIKVAAAGLCHSDLHILHTDETWPFYGTTIGHETAGHIARVGADVTGIHEGDAVLVNLTAFCGHCRNCITGRTNLCLVEGGRTTFVKTPGVVSDGGMADYIKAKAIHVDPIGDLDPITAAPLADAATTPMHAINSARHLLTPDATVVVLAIGGLGHLGLQILKATTGSRLIALDTDDNKLDLARRLGADVVLPSNSTAAAKILDDTHGHGADVVFDFVGLPATIDLGRAVIASGGALRIIGLGGGSFTFTADASGEELPWGVSVQRSNGGSHQDQLETIALAQQHKLTVETTTYPLTHYQQAFHDLQQGTLPGRAVLIP